MECAGAESSVGILPAVPRASRPPRGGRGRPPDSRRDGATIQRVMTLDEYLREAEQTHGHLCAGQVLGVRLAMPRLEKLGIKDPRRKDRKPLATFVEIDRCATDARAVAPGCPLRKRALKLR